MKENSALSTLFRTYLHQDYDLRYATVADALAGFRADATAAERARVVEEIDDLLASHPDDAQLYRELRARGFIFYPPREGETTADWLRRARAAVR